MQPRQGILFKVVSEEVEEAKSGAVEDGVEGGLLLREHDAVDG